MLFRNFKMSKSKGNQHIYDTISRLSNTLDEYKKLLNETREIVFERSEFLQNVYVGLEEFKQLIFKQLEEIPPIKEYTDETREIVFERSEFLQSVYQSFEEFKKLVFKQLEEVQKVKKYPDETRKILDETRSIVFERSEFLQSVYKNLEAFKTLAFEQFETLASLNKRVHSTLFSSESSLNIENLASSVSQIRYQLDSLSSIFNYQNEKVEKLLSEIKPYLVKKEYSEKSHSKIKELQEHIDDYKYVLFESKCRGDEKELKDKQKIYLSYLLELKGMKKPIIDIGCGRGEFLELCKENDIAAKGIDINEAMVHICKQKNLNVVCAEAFEYLAAQKDNSFSAIVAFQIIEHLENQRLIDFIKIAQQKICDGGLIILETINPECVYALRWFYADISHKRPIPAQTLEILLQSVGFKDIKTHLISPVDAYEKLQETADPITNKNIEKLNNFLFGFQEYYAIGKK